MRQAAAATVLIALVGSIAAGQTASSAPSPTASAPATSPTAPGPRVYKMTVRPAAQPDPAMKYRLLPPYLDQTPGNAITLYYMATDALPTENVRQLDEKVAKLLGTPLKDLPLTEARQAFERYSTSLRQVELAARREYVRWEFPIRSEGVAMILPNLSKHRQLARALALRIRVEIAEKEFDKAAHDLQTGYALARHLAEGKTLINALVGVAIAALMSDQVAELMQAQGAPNLYWSLSGLPAPVVDLGPAINLERDWIMLFFPGLLKARQARLSPQEWQNLMQSEIVRARSMMGGAGDSLTEFQIRAMVAAWSMKAYPLGKKYLVEKGIPAKEVEAMPVAQVVVLYTLDGYERLRDELYKWFALPYWQAHEGIQQAHELLAKANESGEGWPFTILLPSLGRAYFLQASGDRRIAALRCIEAVRMYAAAHDGKPPARLEDIKDAPVPIDPVSGKPFKYTPRGDGFLLQSESLSGLSPKDLDEYDVTVAR